jgi:hypothetical protein
MRTSETLGTANERSKLGRSVSAGGNVWGPQLKTDARRGEGPGDWETYQLRRVFRNCRWRYTRKRRQKPAIASMPRTTRSAVTTSWFMPMPSAAPTRAHRDWTVRTSRTSRRMGCSGGSANWRLRSYQESVHTEGQRQAQAAGHLDRAGSGLHDGSDAGAGTDLRSRPSTRAIRQPSWAKRPTGGSRGGGAAVPWPPGSSRRRPRGLLGHCFIPPPGS